MFMATWRTEEEERAAEVRRNKREAEEADKTPIAPGVTARQLMRFRAALIGPPPLPRPRRWYLESPLAAVLKDVLLSVCRLRLYLE